MKNQNGSSDLLLFGKSASFVQSFTEFFAPRLLWKANKNSTTRVTNRHADW